MKPNFITNESDFKAVARALQTELSGRHDPLEITAVSKALFYESDPNIDHSVLETGAMNFVENLKLPNKPKLGVIQQSIAFAFAGCNYQTLKARFDSAA